jgi:hypothetical protein
MALQVEVLGVSFPTINPANVSRVLARAFQICKTPLGSQVDRDELIVVLNFRRNVSDVSFPRTKNMLVFKLAVKKETFAVWQRNFTVTGSDGKMLPGLCASSSVQLYEPPAKLCRGVVLTGIGRFDLRASTIQEEIFEMTGAQANKFESSGRAGCLKAYFSEEAQFAVDALVSVKSVCIGGSLTVAVKAFEGDETDDKFCCFACGSGQHQISGCPFRSKCRLCGGTDHQAVKCPKKTDVKSLDCIVCGGAHFAGTPACPVATHLARRSKAKPPVKPAAKPPVSGGQPAGIVAQLISHDEHSPKIVELGDEKESQSSSPLRKRKRKHKKKSPSASKGPVVPRRSRKRKASERDAASADSSKLPVTTATEPEATIDSTQVMVDELFSSDENDSSASGHRIDPETGEVTDDGASVTMVVKPVEEDFDVDADEL